MRSAGFTAEVSLYRSSASYLSLYSGSDVLPVGIAGSGAWRDFGDPTHTVSNSPPVLAGYCGAEGQPCCSAPFQNLPAFGPLVSCGQGLGCDTLTGKCVASCGGPGQPCCDGPETRALKWTAAGAVYSPTSMGLKEPCRQGGCDKQSHRCFTCGNQDGVPCCPPDAVQYTARCIGPNLECAFASPDGVAGTCRGCGSPGKPPCAWGCENGLNIRDGLCYACGGDGQLPCDGACESGLAIAGGLCRVCGGLGQVACDHGCNGALGPKNGLCAECGSSFQAPCDFGCQPGTRLINGVCKLCGYSGQPPCTNGCVYPEKPAGGVCRVCGVLGQIPCDDGCGQGLVIKNAICTSPTDPVEETCASLGQSCVPSNQPGAHCCQRAGALELCVYEKCMACIQHGAEVPAFGPQICCSMKDGDVPMLDQASGKVICGIPG